MLRITYDPFHGSVFRDGNVESKALADYGYSKTVSDLEIAVASEIYIDAIRLLILEKKIDHKDIAIYYQNQKVEMDENTRIVNWPKGFCDLRENFLLRMLETTIKK